MDLSEIVIGDKYICDQPDGQYFAVVKKKSDQLVEVQFGDKVGPDGDPGDPIDRLGTAGLVWVKPTSIHPM